MSEEQIIAQLNQVLKEDIAKTNHTYEEVIKYADRQHPRGWQNSRKGIAAVRFAVINEEIDKEDVLMIEHTNEVAQEQSSLAIKSSLDAVTAEEFSLSLEQGALKAKALFAAITAAGEGYGYSTIGSAKVKHIKYDGWALVCRAYGSSLAVEQVEVTREANNGPIIRAIATAVVIRDTDGVVTGRAIAECNRQEPNWKNKPDYSLISMAGTRACGKAARLKYSWVLLLSQLFKENNWSFTPEEEMDGVVIVEAKSINQTNQEIPEAAYGTCNCTGDCDRYSPGKHLDEPCVDAPRVLKQSKEGTAFLACSNYQSVGCKATQNYTVKGALV